MFVASTIIMKMRAARVRPVRVRPVRVRMRLVRRVTLVPVCVMLVLGSSTERRPLLCPRCECLTTVMFPRADGAHSTAA
jgi:hypothetical protein